MPRASTPVPVPHPDAPPAEAAWLADLNPEQRRAATFGDGPLLVVAGAGSGKTKTLVARVAHLVHTGVRPERILLLTFTRRAADEMLRRATALLGAASGVATRVWGGTFHATANRLLRLYAQAAGLSPDFTVLDEADAADLMNVVRHELGLGKQVKRFPRKATCLALYSRCVNGRERLEDVLARDFPWCAEFKAALQALFKAYVERKQARHVLDYDDLLLYWRHLLDDERVAREIEARFDHILVDEYQDTNIIQAETLRAMRRQNRNLMVVGDDAQSIYRFRAAAVRNMLDFPKDFPGATLVTLAQNYRSVQPILETTNRVIARAKERYTKDLWSTRREGQRPRLVTCVDETEQDDYVVRRVLEHYEQGIPLRRQAVLVRASHFTDSLEIELARRNIPYHKYGGLRFLEAAHVKDLLSYLRLVENPRDDIAWFRTLQLLDGIGPSVAARAVAHVGQAGHDPRAIRTFAPPPAAREGWTALAAMVDDLVAFAGREPAAQVERVRRFYEPLLERQYDNAAARKRDLEHIAQIASRYRSRSSFLTDLTLDPPTSTSELAGPPVKDEDWLVLSTIHSAKGCEWDVVYLVHASDGCLPSDMATDRDEEIEEERRLAYVAMTRARTFLYITWPLRYYHRWSRFGDRHSYAQVSRFLDPDVRATCDCITAEGAAMDPDAPPSDITPAAGRGAVGEALRSHLDALWN